MELKHFRIYRDGTDWVITDKTGKPIFMLDEASGRSWVRRHSPELGDFWAAAEPGIKAYRVFEKLADPSTRVHVPLTETDMTELDQLLADSK